MPFPPFSSPVRCAHLARWLALAAALFAFFAGLAQAQRVNIAKYQAVAASSVNTSYAADFATDGIVNNFHSLRSNNINGNFFTVEISYPSAVTVASAHLYTGLLETATPTEVLTAYRYQYLEGGTWVTITSVLGNTATEVATIFPAPVTATRFRLLGISNGTFAVREIAFYPPNLSGGAEQGFPLGTDVTLNLAHKRPATASSAQITGTTTPGYAKNAFDGYVDNRSRWLVNPLPGNVYGSGETLEVDLLSTHAVGSAHVYSGFMNASRGSASPVANFELQYHDGAAWLPIPGATITDNTSSALAIEFSSPVSTSRIRLITTSATAARIQELLLFPPREGGYALGREIIDAAPPTDSWERYSDSFYRIRNTGPDLRIGLVNGAIVNVPAEATFPMRTEWQLLLNYRDGTYRIRNFETGLCLALSALSTAAGLPVVATDYSGLPHQDWRIVYNPTTPTQFALVNAYSGHALQPLNNSWASGTSLIVAPHDPGLNLQHWTASLRRIHPKKGVAATGSVIGARYTAAPGLTFHEDFHNRLNGFWGYSWNRQTNATFPFLRTDYTFNPMQWGNGRWTHGNASSVPLERNHRDLQSTGKPVSLLGFNEPEHEEQGFTPVADAIMHWPRFEARDVPLVAPAPASINGAWFADFDAQANARGYRRDYNAVHWYAGPNSDSLITLLTNVYNNFGRPIWLTEFGNTRWSGNATWTEAASFNFLAEFMWRAEALPWLKRYSIFGYIEEVPGAPPPVSPDPPEAPRSNILRHDGSLTPLGQLYAGWDGVTAVVGNRAYHLHNHGEYRRAFNPGFSGEPASVSPDDPDLGVQWFLSPGVTANTWRILSTRDGRPLRTTDGGTVSLGAAGQTGAEVEWRVAAESNGHGRQYIEHPATGRRLRAFGDGSLGLGALTSTADAFKWRLVAPAAADPVGPPATPTGLSASASANGIALSWSPVAGATAYTVERAPSATGPWATVVADLAGEGVTDAGLAWATTYHYRVTATNIHALASPVSAVVAATTDAAPADPFATWLTVYSLSGDAASPAADLDGDGLPNLLEYALGSDPLVPTPALAAGVTEASPRALRLTFSRIADPALVYTVEASTTLGGWAPIWTSTGAQNVAGPVTVTDPVALAEHPRRFIRLAVSR